MLIGYGSDDRIMDPQGAYRLYQAAVNSKRDMMAGLGHPRQKPAGRGTSDRQPFRTGPCDSFAPTSSPDIKSAPP